jgi:4,5-DOPA dioxygenase extradiol
VAWPARGAPASLVSRVRSLLTDANFIVSENSSRGFDHGVFVPLAVAFPRAEVPVLQVSLLRSLDPAAHWELGRALAPLRAEGVLVIGSGFLTHNLRDMDRAPGQPAAPWAADFAEWAASAILARPVGTPPSAVPRRGASGTPQPHASLGAALVDAAHRAPHFARAHPRIEHWLPLLVAAGAADPAPHHGAKGACVAKELLGQVVMGTAAVSSYQFDSTAGDPHALSSDL